MVTEEGPDAAGVAHKVLNNNVVITVDGAGHERVLMGRGLGFGLKPNDPIDTSRVQKTFVLDGRSSSDYVRRLLSDVPYPVVEAVNLAVDEAERFLGRDLGRVLPLAVIDHIQFVLDRLAKGTRIPASLPELRVLYPQEYRAATLMAATIGRSLGVGLPDEEAVFLTMHLINTTREELEGGTALLFRRVHHVVATVEAALGIELDVESHDYARFVVHVQFLLQRVTNESMLTTGDAAVFELVKRSYPRSFAIAEQVDGYLGGVIGAKLTDEELLYVTVHVERLAQQVAPGASDEKVI